MIYLARDLRLGRQVSLKNTLPEAAEREGRLLASLRHPGLPFCVDSFVERGTGFLVLEYVAGEDALAALRRQPTLERAIQIGELLLDIVSYLHACAPPVIHGDIKPDHLRVTPTGGLVLLFFPGRRWNIEGRRWNIEGRRSFMAGRRWNIEGRRSFESRGS